MPEERCGIVVDEALVDRLARLCAIELSDQERQSLRRDLQQMIAYFDRLGELELEGVDPSGYRTRVSNVLRPDAPRAGLSREAAFRNAPDSQDSFFKAPPILEKE
jgi:aspartyl-tRNA(Asn)/glutamyl-tRNA(Gln) amidotransferase subunit C